MFWLLFREINVRFFFDFAGLSGTLYASDNGLDMFFFIFDVGVVLVVVKACLAFDRGTVGDLLSGLALEVARLPPRRDDLAASPTPSLSIVVPVRHFSERLPAGMTAST